MEFSFVGTHTTAGWKRWTGRNIEVQSGSVSIARRLTLDVEALDLEARSLDRDAFGILYGVAPDGHPFRYDPATDRYESLSPRVGQWLNVDASAIGVGAHDLYLLDDEREQLTAFSRSTQTGRWMVRIDRPMTVVTSDGRGYALTRGNGVGDGRLVAVDSDGELELIATGFESPIDLSIDSTGTRYVLDRLQGRHVVWAFDSDGVPRTDGYPLEVDPDRVPRSGEPTCLEAIAEDRLLIGYRWPTDGSTVVEHRPYHDPAPLPGFDRPCMALLTERSGSLDDSGVTSTADDGTTAWYAIDDTQQVYRLTPRRETARNDRTGRHDADLYRRLDAGTPATEWHRMTMETGGDESNAQVRVTYYASDTPVLPLEDVPGIDEAAIDRLRTESITSVGDFFEQRPETLTALFDDVSADEVRQWHEYTLDAVDETLDRHGEHVDGASPADALLTNATGQYLYVRLTLIGSVRTTPAVTAFRAYCPQQSYLRYLPELYREDPDSAAFLERFLSIFESVFTDIEEEFEHVSQYFDPYGTPSEAIPWLEEWLAVEVVEGMGESVRRELISRAPELYRSRGTRWGLTTLLSIYLKDVSPPVPDWRLARRREQETLAWLVYLGVLTDARAEEALSQYTAVEHAQEPIPSVLILEHGELSGIDDPEVLRAYERLVEEPGHARVLLAPAVDDEHVRIVDRLVELETPAHAVTKTIRLQSQFALGTHTYLGINTRLPPHQFELGDAVLGETSELTGGSVEPDESSYRPDESSHRPDE